MNKELQEIILGIKRALGLMGDSERVSLSVASALMVITGLLTNLPAIILGRLVDTITAQRALSYLQYYPFIAFIILIIIIKEALTVVRKYLVENAATQTEKKQTVSTVEHLLKSNINYINKQQIGSLHGRTFRSIQGLVRLIKLTFLDFLPTFFSAVAALSIAFFQRSTIAFIMLLVIPTGLYIIVKQISSQKGIRVFLLRGKEKIDGAVVEMLGGLETVRVLGTERQEVQRVEEVAEQLRRKEIKHHVSMALYDSWKYLNEGFFYILIISLAIYLSVQGSISKGDILVYSILFLSVTGPLREIHRILDQAHESSILVNDLCELKNEPIDPSFTTLYQTVESPTGIKTNNTIIETQHLSFSYPSRTEKILNDVSLRIFEGEKIGIAGASGCGKTTFVKILLKLVHGYTGNAYLFGKDLGKITRDEISAQVAYVPQKVYIFSGSVKENIIYGCGRESITEEEIIGASKKSRIYDEIINSLGGFDGKVTENGNNLSGGQKQRLAIARLILKSPQLIIFDEATSALDNTNEGMVHENIKEIFKERTQIIIAHRLTTLRDCNRILVFDKGGIVQEGSFEQLSNADGLFRSFLISNTVRG